MTAFWVVLVLLILLVVGIVLYGVGGYNNLVRTRNLVEESWRQVDVELNRRYDLIPNLVETVKGYASHESGTLEEVVRLRNQAAGMASGAPSEQRAGVEEQLTGAIRQLLVTVEAYPDLKANTNFLELQRQLADTEDRIANGRRYYNANVRNYNTRIESFPTNFIASFGKFERATYFEVNERCRTAGAQGCFRQRTGRPVGRRRVRDPQLLGPCRHAGRAPARGRTHAERSGVRVPGPRGPARTGHPADDAPAGTRVRYGSPAVPAAERTWVHAAAVLRSLRIAARLEHRKRIRSPLPSLYGSVPGRLPSHCRRRPRSLSA